MPRSPLQFTIQTPQEISSCIGFNIPWLKYDTGAENNHDGYGNGFNDSYFNGTGANSNIQAQLDLMQSKNVKYIRLWLNIYHYMNANKEEVGYTAFRAEFLTNLATYCDWCNARGIKMLICLDDCWYTFPWWWIGTVKEDSYVQACVDVVTALKDKPAVWGWDYCNEPYMGWWNSAPTTTKHTHYQDGSYAGHDICTIARATTFFIRLYTTLKAIAPTHLFSVGESKPNQNTLYGISAACDFYQLHWYGTDASLFTYKASDYDKLAIIGEYGYNKAGEYLTHDDFTHRLTRKMLENGFPLVMPWAIGGAWNRVGTNSYQLNNTLNILNSF